MNGKKRRVWVFIFFFFSMHICLPTQYLLCLIPEMPLCNDDRSDFELEPLRSLEILSQEEDLNSILQLIIIYQCLCQPFHPCRWFGMSLIIHSNFQAQEVFHWCLKKKKRRYRGSFWHFTLKKLFLLLQTNSKVNLRRKLTVHVVNIRSKCAAANITAVDLLDLSDLPWRKDAEVCEDIKFAAHVLCMTTKPSMTGVTVRRLLTDHKLHLLFGS